MPGVCKHLLLFLALLMKGGLIQNLPTLTSPLGMATDRIKMLSRKDVYHLLSGLKQELIANNELRKGWKN